MRGSPGRLVTWIAVAFVVAVAALATVDAMPTGGREEAERERGVAGRLPAVSAELRAAGIAGTLAYVDTTCRVHIIALPALRELDAAPLPGCRLAPAFAPPRSLPISASASAVGPDGSVAFLRGSDVALWPFGCIEAVASPCVRTILPRRTLAGALGATTPQEIGIEELAPLGDDRLAAVVRLDTAEPPQTVVAVFDGRRLLATVPWFPSQRVRFAVSPSGEYVAVESRRPNRVFLIDRDGDIGVLPDVARSWFGRTSLHGANAIAWSPDERFTALAKEEGLYVFTTRDGDGARLVRLPFIARDLAWD